MKVLPSNQHIFLDGKRISSMVAAVSLTELATVAPGSPTLTSGWTADTEDPPASGLPGIAWYEETMLTYHPDHLGSSVLISSGNGRPYYRSEMKPYGEMHQEWRAGDPAATTEDPPGAGTGQPLVNHLFTGYERDFETGYDHAQARYYDPEVARWNAADPVFGEHYLKSDPQKATNQGVFKGQNLSVYSVVWHSPLKYSDPGGDYIVFLTRDSANQFVADMRAREVDIGLNDITEHNASNGVTMFRWGITSANRARIDNPQNRANEIVNEFVDAATNKDETHVILYQNQDVRDDGGTVFEYQPRNGSMQTNSTRIRRPNIATGDEGVNVSTNNPLVERVRVRGADVTSVTILPSDGNANDRTRTMAYEVLGHGVEQQSHQEIAANYNNPLEHEDNTPFITTYPDPNNDRYYTPLAVPRAGELDITASWVD